MYSPIISKHRTQINLSSPKKVEIRHGIRRLSHKRVSPLVERSIESPAVVFGSPGGVGGVLVEHRAISVADCQHKKLLTAEGSLPFYMFLHLHIILLSTHFHLANNTFFLVPKFPSSMNHSYL